MSIKSLTLLACAATSASLIGANQKSDCKNQPGVCNEADCCRIYCMGPEQEGVNPAVGPRTCNGDIAITVAGFYWNAHQDGMEYAIESESIYSNDGTDRENIIGGKFKNPDFDWNWGFKLGLGYNSPCDGWDIGITWTSYKGSASSHNETEIDDNRVLLTLWTDFNSQDNDDYPLFATDIETKWKLDLNLIDIELGRDSWFTKRISFRPFIGLRIAYIKQDFDIEHKGGVFSEANNSISMSVNDYVDLDNDFRGVGFRGGFDTVWNIGCGWGIYGNMAFSVVYGRFDIDHDEWYRDAEAPFTKTIVLEAKDSFRTSRYMTDVGIGIRYAMQFCECQYALAVSLGWEQHLFLGQNQMWRIVRDADDLNDNSNSIFHQRRGDLDTQGWTLKVVFDF